MKCELPGCEREATEARSQRSGDVLHVCGQPHVFPPPTEGDDE